MSVDLGAACSASRIIGGASSMKPLNICVLSGSILVVSAFISADHACAQREIDYELHTQTMFDWYVARSEDRKGTAFNIVSQVFLPKNEQDFSKFVRAAKALVECIDQRMGGPDGELVAKYVEVCMALIRARGLLE
jgi:hypothetical protein